MNKRLFASWILLLSLSWLMAPPSHAGNAAEYHLTGSRVFWFMEISDLHIGDSGSQDTDYLAWAVTDLRDAIDPLFIVASGDLTDSTNGGTIPNGPYPGEWQAYRQILDTAGMDAAFYYDLTGNHDHYNDALFAYYLAYSIQGSANGTTQHSWVKTFPFGAYHFLGISTPGNDGAPFSIWPWDNYGDHAGLDDTELAYIESELSLHQDAELTMIFGHHPFEAGYSSALDTGLTYGLGPFLGHIDNYGVPFYGFGHTHQYLENTYYDSLSRDIFYMNYSSLGEEDQDHFAVIAVDGNGVSMVPGQHGLWPVVCITAPMDRCLGDCTNPYAYDIPQARVSPIRALVFDEDENPVTQVEFRMDETGDWQPMQQVDASSLWAGTWDASAATPGSHIIEVRAQGPTTVTDRIETVVVEEAPVELAVDFGVNGLWLYGDEAWNQLHSGNARGLETYGGNLVADASVLGLYLYDGTWHQISPNRVDGMVSDGEVLYVDFGSHGLWKYENDVWDLLTGINMDRIWLCGQTLIAGHDTLGLYLYDGAVTKIRDTNAQDVVSDRGVLYADFGSDGLWKFQDEIWTRLTGINVHAIWMSDHRLIAGLNGIGLYAYDGTVAKIRSRNAEEIVTDRGILYADFGTEGLWKYADHVWTMINAGDAENMWVLDQKLMVDFGSAGLFMYDGIWTFLNAFDADDAADYTQS